MSRKVGKIRAVIDGTTAHTPVLDDKGNHIPDVKVQPVKQRTRSKVRTRKSTSSSPSPVPHPNVADPGGASLPSKLPHTILKPDKGQEVPHGKHVRLPPNDQLPKRFSPPASMDKLLALRRNSAKTVPKAVSISKARQRYLESQKWCFLSQSERVELLNYRHKKNQWDKGIPQIDKEPVQHDFGHTATNIKMVYVCVNKPDTNIQVSYDQCQMTSPRNLYIKGMPCLKDTILKGDTSHRPSKQEHGCHENRKKIGFKPLDDTVHETCRPGGISHRPSEPVFLENKKMGFEPSDDTLYDASKPGGISHRPSEPDFLENKKIGFEPSDDTVYDISKPEEDLEDFDSTYYSQYSVSLGFDYAEGRSFHTQGSNSLGTNLQHGFTNEASRVASWKLCLEDDKGNGTNIEDDSNFYFLPPTDWRPAEFHMPLDREPEEMLSQTIDTVAEEPASTIPDADVGPGIWGELEELNQSQGHFSIKVDPEPGRDELLERRRLGPSRSSITHVKDAAVLNTGCDYTEDIIDDMISDLKHERVDIIDDLSVVPQSKTVPVSDDSETAANSALMMRKECLPNGYNNHSSIVATTTSSGHFMLPGAANGPSSSGKAASGSVSSEAAAAFSNDPKFISSEQSDISNLMAYSSLRTEAHESELFLKEQNEYRQRNALSNRSKLLAEQGFKLGNTPELTTKPATTIATSDRVDISDNTIPFQQPFHKTEAKGASIGTTTLRLPYFSDDEEPSSDAGQSDDQDS